MRARAVIGANFGDEGKGLVTDYLCSQGAGVVVRFNGGAQAGHTVVLPNGKRHVFSHFGSGAFCGVPTFLSQFFVLNPLAFFDEVRRFEEIGATALMGSNGIFAHPNCVVTTFADMIFNQRLEDVRADKRHGSVGLGVNETIERSDIGELKITMSDLWNRINIKDKLKTICSKYAEFRTGKPIDRPEAMIEAFVKQCEAFAQIVSPAGMDQCKDPVFEGAQGLLLSQDNKEFFPHLTRSNTGMKNVRVLCEQAGITDVDIYYVSRTYLTRHGAGPLPGEDASLKYKDDTNLEHPFQGALRFAKINYPDLMERCEADAGSDDFKLVLTHCDQREPGCTAELYSYGETRNDIREERDGVAVTRSRAVIT